MAPWADDVLAASGVMMDRAGCLLVPFLPVRAGGRLTVSRTHVAFTPVLHWAWLARPVSLPLADIADVQLGGGGVQFSITDLISVGRRLTITMRDGRRHVFRGLQIEDVYLTIQQALDQDLGARPKSETEHTEQHGTTSEERYRTEEQR